MNIETVNAAAAHAISEYPREACGLVVAVGRKETFIPCKNIAQNPAEHFSIDPVEYAAAEDRGEILAVVHSHPDASPMPSPTDRSVCAAMGIPWLILAIHTDPATPDVPPVLAGFELVTPEEFELPYRGREYIFGRQDCFSLIRDFYKRDMGIELNDFKREDKFWERGENLYMDNLEAEGFELIDAPSQKGDIILMAIRSDIVNHGAIWLGDMDAMLHHPYEHLSERVVYGGFWAEHTRHFARKVR